MQIIGIKTNLLVNILLKLIIPINKIDSQMGGIEILNSKKSKNPVNNFSKSDYKMIA